MRIKLHQRQRAVFLRMRLEQRIGHRMVAAKAEHQRPGVKDPVGMRFDAVEHAGGVMRVDETVAIIHRRKRFERIETEREMFQLGQLHRTGAYGARPKTTSGTVGHGIVIGYAADHEVDPGKLATVAATREAQRPAICHLGPTPAPVTVAEGLISSSLVTLAVIMRHGWLPFGCDWGPRTMPLR